MSCNIFLLAAALLTGAAVALALAGKELRSTRLAQQITNFMSSCWVRARAILRGWLCTLLRLL
jgi:hypothetical protein